MTSSNNHNTEQKQDWFLIGIIVSILLIVVVTLILIMRIPEQRDYLADSEAESVAFNYLLALQKNDYERAYQYLSPELAGYPADGGEFFDDLQAIWDCSADELERTDFKIDKVERFDNRAAVSMSETVYTNNRGLFASSSYARHYQIRLIEAPAGWRITNSEKCWNHAWDTAPEEQ